MKNCWDGAVSPPAPSAGAEGMRDPRTAGH